jgi:hypothetical protein
MKRFVLAAVAVLGLGIGAASAHAPVTNHLGQPMWGPAYNNEVTGG